MKIAFLKTSYTIASILFLIIFIFSLNGCQDQDAKNFEKPITTINDILAPNVKVGVQIGTTSEEHVKTFFKNNHKEDKYLELFNSSPDAIAALIQNKIEAVVVDEVTGIEFVKTNPSLTLLNAPLSTEIYAGIISKNNIELLNEFNKALQKIKDNGIYNKLVDTYLNKNSNYHYIPKVTKGNPLIIATNAQFPPYEYYANNKIIGFEIEIAYAIGDIINRPIVIDDMEFDSIINAIGSHKADIGMAGFSVTEERAKTINFTADISHSNISIVVNKPNTIMENTSFFSKFKNNFIVDDRWMLLAKGLANTLLISSFALILGLLGGFFMALVRTQHDMFGSFRFLNFIFKLYINIVRGTPIMVQLLIIYYVIFSSVDINKIIVAIIAFGLNSMAYTSEIFRSGIMSIDKGQFEAGHSLGLKQSTVMRRIILPQAIKNVLPALVNEAISLIKDTSICGYIGLMDLTRGGVIIRNITYEAFLPLFAIAIIYLAIVGCLSLCASKLEKRLKKNER